MSNIQNRKLRIISEILVTIALVLTITGLLIWEDTLDKIIHLQDQAIVRLTHYPVKEVSRINGYGLAMTHNGQACLLESSDVTCFDNIRDVVAIHHDNSGNYFILRKSGEILSYRNYQSEHVYSLWQRSYYPERTIQHAVKVFDEYPITSFQSFGVIGCCDLINIGHSIPLIKPENPNKVVIVIN